MREGEKTCKRSAKEKKIGRGGVNGAAREDEKEKSKRRSEKRVRMRRKRRGKDPKK